MTNDINKSQSLSSARCMPCEGGTPPLTKEESEKLFAQVSNQWQLGENKISADFKFKNFKESMAFINKVADIAESEGHHPDIYIYYAKVRLELSTHAIGGLSINDFIMASKIDTLL